MTEVIVLTNQGKIKMFGEKETYKYLEILDVDTIKHPDMKKIQRNTPGELANYSKLYYIAEFSWNG